MQCLAQTPEHSCKNLQIIVEQGKFWMQSNNLQSVVELLANAKLGQVYICYVDSANWTSNNKYI